MIHNRAFEYIPNDTESEKASFAYLMSLMAVVIGLPFPIFNLIATLIFFLANRKSTLFVRWHTTQALLAQISLIFFNSYGFFRLIRVVFFGHTISNEFISYMIILIFVNVVEGIGSIYSAIVSRKGRHPEWWLYASLIKRNYEKATLELIMGAMLIGFSYFLLSKVDWIAILSVIQENESYAWYPKTV